MEFFIEFDNALDWVQKRIKPKKEETVPNYWVLSFCSISG